MIAPWSWKQWHMINLCFEADYRFWNQASNAFKMKVLSTCDILLILSVINLSFSQFHSRYQHKVRSRRNNRPRHGNISPRILNKDTPIVSDGFHSPSQFQQQASRRIDIVSEASFVPSKTVNFDPDFQSIEESDFHTSETGKKPVVFRNERLSNPLQFKSSKNSGMDYTFL